ncbi:NAD(P)H-dependent oxidoreductase [Nocardioides litoris]|uniref:NAD(P)H-dependent oxidoreductase n=1 Tax=Nocardioides litoris TaxID=1926648 RepID=UPI00111EFD8F|nr:NAD(P)H-dependent oxidoreductase [Nocardioides litoris]
MSGPGGHRVAVVVGNPKPASRTLAAATYVARELAGDEPDLVVDLATVGPGLLDQRDPVVGDLVAEVAAADLVVVASPTYKATYTGLLKLFLDRFAPDFGTGMTGLAVPLMLGGGPAHALAPELTLRPVLTEIGAVVPVRALYVLDAAHDDPAAYDAWLTTARPIVTTLLAARLHARSDARSDARTGAPA